MPEEGREEGNLFRTNQEGNKKTSYTSTQHNNTGRYTRENSKLTRGESRSRYTMIRTLARSPYLRPSPSLHRASLQLFITPPPLHLLPSSYSSSTSLWSSQSSASRHFSSSSKNDFNEVIKKMKEEYDEHGVPKTSATASPTSAAAATGTASESGTEEKSEEENLNQEGKDSKDENDKKGEEGKENEKGPTDYVQLFNQTLWKSRDLTSSFISSVKETWSELIEGPKESKIRKTVAHAEVIRKKAKSEEDEDEDEPAAAPYAGPTAVVVSKSKKSTWEEMAARLENSPLIREMLKNSRKIGRQAADTDLGKQAQKIGEQVTNKIHVSPHKTLSLLSRHLTLSPGCKRILGNYSEPIGVQDLWCLGKSHSTNRRRSCRG